MYIGDDHRGHMVIDRTSQKNDPLAQEPGIDVETALTAARILDNLRNEVIIVDLYRTAIAHGGGFPDENARVETTRRLCPRLTNKDTILARKCEQSFGLG
jgi:hypothetical protein